MALDDFSPWTSEVIGKNERGEDVVKRKNLPIWENGCLMLSMIIKPGE